MNVAPSTPRWLEQLHRLLVKVRLPVRDVVLAQRTLCIDLALPGPSPLTTQVHPARDDLDGFARTKRFVVAYQGHADLQDDQRRALDLLAQILRRIEHDVPASLEGSGAVFVTDASWEQRFLRLYPFCTVERSRSASGPITEVLVRMTSACNQSCPFCSAPAHDAPSHTEMRALIRDAAQGFPGAMLSLTGGEPTLRASFVDEVVLALDQPDFVEVQVQTNGVAFASKIDPARLPASTRLSFFFSLHAIDESIYDLCTGTRGQLPFALRGLERLCRAGHRVTVNCVANAANLDHLPDYVRGLPGLVPAGGQVDLHFSTLICPEARTDAEAFLVPYPLLAERLATAVELAHQAGVSVQSLRASTHAAMPACQLDPELRSRDPHHPLVLPHEAGPLEDGRPWVKAPACADCDESPHCLGVPRPYALRFGLGGLHPIREA